MQKASCTINRATISTKTRWRSFNKSGMRRRQHWTLIKVAADCATWTKPRKRTPPFLVLSHSAGTGKRGGRGLLMTYLATFPDISPDCFMPTMLQCRMPVSPSKLQLLVGARNNTSRWETAWWQLPPSSFQILKEILKLSAARTYPQENTSMYLCMKIDKRLTWG